MSLAISTIKTAMQTRLGNIGDVTDAMLIDWADNLNQRLYRASYGEDPTRYMAAELYTVSASPTTSALPTIETAEEYGCGFYVLDSSSNVIDKLIPQPYGSTLKGYHIIGDNVTFTGITTSTSISFKYIPVLTSLSATSSTFIVPDRFKEMVVWGMIVLYYQAFKDPEEYNADQKFARLYDEFLDSLPKFPQVMDIYSNYPSY